MGANKKSGVTQEDLDKAELIELYVYFEKLTGYFPAAGKHAEEVKFDILEFVESDGARFFHGKSKEWLQNELRHDGTYEPSYRRLVTALRKEKQYSYNSWRESNARHADVDVSLCVLFFNDFPFHLREYVLTPTSSLFAESPASSG